jgi:hypothetical protein
MAMEVASSLVVEGAGLVDPLCHFALPLALPPPKQQLG